MRLGFEGVSVSAALGQADDEREADAEPPGDLAQGTLVVVHSGRDPLTKVGRIGAHGDCLPNGRLYPYSSRMQPGGKLL